MSRVKLTINGEDSFYIEQNDSGEAQIRPVNAPLVSRDDRITASVGSEHGSRPTTMVLEVENVP